MLVTSTTHNIVCDVCNKTKVEPNAVAGSYRSGWENINDKDLCDICYQLFVSDVMKFVTKQNMISSLLESFIETKKPTANTIFDNLYTLEIK